MTCFLPSVAQLKGVCEFLQLVTNLCVRSCHRLDCLEADADMEFGMQDIY